jgi:hypothetical protein
MLLLHDLEDLGFIIIPNMAFLVEVCHDFLKFHKANVEMGPA